jgi:NAD(P)-dependent dehydrogenase (short-subunit alcohol dehydrogenase family)
VNGGFSGKSYFISGGAKGLGRAIAEGLCGRGATVGIADIDALGLEETAVAIAASGGKCRTFTADVGVRSAFADAVAAFAAEAGGLDGMINNASHLVYEPISEVSEDVLDRMIGAGFKSAVWGSQALVRHRRPHQPAAIVNFSSPVVFKGYPRSAIYSAIKSAVASLTRTLAAELGPDGIRVNSIAPGSVPTPGALKYVDAQEYARRSETIPLRRLGHEQDVVNGVCFLLSDQASFVNGATLAVDGGIIAAA